jgi:hypothetical protein
MSELTPTTRVTAESSLTAEERTLAATVIIPVRDRWEELGRCIAAVTAQEVPGGAEVIVIDDGSREDVDIGRQSRVGRIPVTVLRQERSGRSNARNTGVGAARGRLLIFLDSDAVPDVTFLPAMTRAAEENPSALAFQGNLRADDTTLVWRAEGARLSSIQRTYLQPDGRLDFFNTAAAAVRSSYVPASGELFEPEAVRGGDTLLLCRLRSEGHLPAFVETATAVHRPRGSLGAYLLRHFEVGFRGSPARSRLAGAGGLLSIGGRLRMLQEIARTCRRCPDGALVGAIVLVAYGLEIIGRAASVVSQRAMSANDWRRAV